ncbi:MAG TPA: hypothetical protein PK089_03460 [Methanoregulaceae archaeon]|nr:hypothetical protein [Methanoregulaceae archaeon]HQJ87267.1 hypothetical protein [Methanoregulaceae archaeon]
MTEETMQAFARACAGQNSIEEILEGLERSPGGEFVYVMNIASIADCIDWDLTPLEWVRGLNLALLYKLAEPAENWEEADAAARALRRYEIAIDTREDTNGFFRYSIVRGRGILEEITRALPCVRLPESEEPEEEV